MYTAKKNEIAAYVVYHKTLRFVVWQLLCV